MHRALHSRLLTLCSGILFVIGSATATSVTRTTFSGWKTTLTGAPTEADWTTVQFRNYDTAAGITLSAVGNASIGFNFTGPDNGGDQLSGMSYNGVTGLAGSADAGAGISVTTPASGENALLLSIGSTGNTPLTLALSDGQSFTLSNGFFGIAISHPITSLLLTTTAGSQAVIDDFWFGTSSLAQDQAPPPAPPDPTPAAEGATFILMAGGGLVLLGAKRNFRQPVKSIS